MWVFSWSWTCRWLVESISDGILKMSTLILLTWFVLGPRASLPITLSPSWPWQDLTHKGQIRYDPRDMELTNQVILFEWIWTPSNGPNETPSRTSFTWSGLAGQIRVGSPNRNIMWRQPFWDRVHSNIFLKINFRKNIKCNNNINN